MTYKWLVIWWIITVTQGSQTQGDGVRYSDNCISGTYSADTILKRVELEETHRKMTVNFALFKTKEEAEKYMTGSYGYSGNTKHKYQLVELKPTISWQRPDALDRDKELLKDE